MEDKTIIIMLYKMDMMGSLLKLQKNIDNDIMDEVLENSLDLVKKTTEKI